MTSLRNFLNWVPRLKFVSHKILNLQILHNSKSGRKGDIPSTQKYIDSFSNHSM